jgi:alginate O-acetyltransferase complex protein AlgI
MLFNSFQLIFVFFPVCLAVATRLRGSALLVWVNLSSVVFYALTGHAWFVIPMLFTTILDFKLSHLLARQNSDGARRAVLIGSLCANFGLLFYFKYAGFFVDTVVDTLGLLGATGGSGEHDSLEFLRVILPAGISFYTFQTVAYMVDVYRGHTKPERSFWRFAGFVSFFPHLVAGPLTRHHELVPGLARIEQDGVRPRWREGVPLFVIGLSKKVLIADRIAHFIDPLLLQPADLTMTTAWLSLLGFSLQIYFDFSAYSDMAIGLSRLLGVELPQNFNNPYQALSPQDFWKRWHITLSRWLRDYLYIPLGGNRKGPARRYINLALTMLLGGLWHGASWTFAIWGLYHGGLLVLHRLLQEQWEAWPSWAQRVLTFSLVTFGWLFFRCSNLDEAGTWMGALVGHNGFHTPFEKLPKLAALVVLGLVLVNFFPVASSWPKWRTMPWVGQVVLAALFVASILMIHESSRFIYFQF